MPWTAPEIARTSEPSMGDEQAVLNGWLDYQRDTLLMSIRSLFVHLIEEYARHNGHADLLRQRIDGATGT